MRNPLQEVRGMEGIKEAAITIKPSANSPFKSYDKVRSAAHALLELAQQPGLFRPVRGQFAEPLKQ